uniref:Uncharacterized protein n=1 Tax=Sphaerodactylus townsendi TaxID=933632 RepID=A0ACB8EBB9_9SAUR
MRPGRRLSLLCCCCCCCCWLVCGGAVAAAAAAAAAAAPGPAEYAIAEETPRGAPVGNVARDLGLEAAWLPSRKGRLVGAGGEYLTLEAATGALSVGRPVDRERICALQPSCALSYELVLENPLELHPLRLRVLDVNDHAPRFPRADYQLSLAEFLAPGARLALPSAHDPDEGSHAVQSYALSADPHFGLAMQTRADGTSYPELVLERPLDRERQAAHRLLLTAFDGGSPARSGSTQLSRGPQCTGHQRQLAARLRATDPDEGPNGEVSYAFSNSTPPELRRLFTVDGRSGEVRLAGSLDGQTPPLELFVEARDRGPFGLSGQAKLLVDITDVNNHAPEIVVTSLSSPVPEDSPLGTVVALLSITDRDPGENGRVICQVPTQLPFQLRSSFDSYYTLVTSGLLDRRREVEVTENNQPGLSLFHVAASDPDLGENGRVSYQLRDIDIQGTALSAYLGIDAEAGTVYAKGSFDFEQLQSFHFQVEAVDHGSPALVAAFLVSISVLDQNDNAPHILYPAVSKNGSVAVEIVPRLADADYLVTKVVAHDPDSGQNAWLSFHLLQASDASLFRVSPDAGEVRTARSLRSSDALRHKVVVLVKDRGEPPLSTSLTLGVLLADSLPQALPDFDDSLEARSGQPLTRLNFYLIVSLGCLSCLFFGFLLVLLILRLVNCRTGPTRCCCCCCPDDEYEKYRYNVRMLPGSHFTPEMN